MLVNYFIAASLTTLYLIAGLYRRVVQARRGGVRKRRRTLRFDLFASAIGSVKGFVDGSLFFSLALLAAALFTLNHVIWRNVFTSIPDPDAITTRYEEVLMAISGTFSVFPAMILQSVHPVTKQRAMFYGLVWLVVGIQLLFILGFSLAKVAPYETNQEIFVDEAFKFIKGLTSREEAFDKLCADVEVFDIAAATRSLWLSVPLLVIFAIDRICRHDRATAPWRPSPPPSQKTRSPRLDKFRKNTRRVIACISFLGWTIPAFGGFAALWGYLFVFMTYRRAVMEKSGASDDGAEAQWTFGQVLALLTWVPALVDFIYIFWRKSSDTNRCKCRFQLLHCIVLMGL